MDAMWLPVSDVSFSVAGHPDTSLLPDDFSNVNYGCDSGSIGCGGGVGFGVCVCDNVPVVHA